MHTAGPPYVLNSIHSGILGQAADLGRIERIPPSTNHPARHGIRMKNVAARPVIFALGARGPMGCFRRCGESDLRDLNLRRPVEAYGPISSLNGTREVHMAHGRDPVTAPVRFRASCVACLFRPTSDLFLLVYPTVPPISSMLNNDLSIRQVVACRVGPGTTYPKGKDPAVRRPSSSLPLTNPLREV